VGENGPDFSRWQIGADDGNDKNNDREENENLYNVVNEKIDRLGGKRSGQKGKNGIGQPIGQQFYGVKNIHIYFPYYTPNFLLEGGKHPHQESHIKTERRNAPALLLVRLSASVKKGVEKAILSCSELRTMFGGLFKRKNHGLADYIYFACQQINPCHR